LAWTSSDVDALQAAIATGVLTVEYSDRKVTYQTTKDMLQALSVMQQEVALTASGSTSRTRYAATTKGV